MVCYYASVGGAPRYKVVVCVLFFRLFSAQLLKTRCWKSQCRHNTVFSWISIDNIFDLKCCSIDMAWYTHLDTPLLAIQSPVKSKLSTTNCLSPQQIHQYYKLDGDPSEISRTSASKLTSAMGMPLECSNCVVIRYWLIWHMPSVHMLIVLLSLLCT